MRHWRWFRLICSFCTRGDWGQEETRLDQKSFKKNCAWRLVSWLSPEWQHPMTLTATCAPATLSSYTQHMSDFWSVNLLILLSEFLSCQQRALTLNQVTLISLCCHTLLLRELITIHAPPSRVDDWKCVSGFSWIPPYVPFSLADFNLYPFSVINCNDKYNSLSESSESLQWLTEHEGGLEDTKTPAPFTNISHCWDALSVEGALSR